MMTVMTTMTMMMLMVLKMTMALSIQAFPGASSWERRSQELAPGNRVANGLQERSREQAPGNAQK